MPENQTVWKPDNQGVKEETSSRLLGGAETGSRGGEDAWQSGSWRIGQARQWLVEQVIPHLRGDKLGGTTGEQDRLCNPGFQCGEIKPQNL